MFVSNYKPRSAKSQYFLGVLSNLMDFYPSKHVNKVVLEDFNSEPTSPTTLNLYSG